MLEVASLVDVGKYTEELLSYMCSTIGPDPATTMLCVQQVGCVMYWLCFMLLNPVMLPLLQLFQLQLQQEFV